MNSYKFLGLSTFLLIVNSMYIWFTWSIPAAIMNLICAIPCYRYYVANKQQMVPRSKFFCFALAVVLVYQSMRVNFGLYTWISSFIFYFIVLFYISLPAATLRYLLDLTKKWMVRLLIPSLVIHFIVMITHVPSPFTLDFFADSHYGIFSNYLLYIDSQNEATLRFNGPFLEPGYLGMITSFLLFAYKYDLKDKDVRWLFVFNLLTLSLAAYVLSLVGWLLLYVIEKKKIITPVLLLCIGIFAFSHISEDSVLGENIVSRLAFDEEKGIAGNNRVTEGIFYYLNNMDINSYLFGYGGELRKDADFAGSGYLMAMVYYGIVYFILWFLVYISVIRSSIDRKYAFMFLLIFILASMQRFYPYWFSWLFIYIASIYTTKSNRIQ